MTVKKEKGEENHEEEALQLNSVERRYILGG